MTTTPRFLSGYRLVRRLCLLVAVVALVVPLSSAAAQVREFRSGARVRLRALGVVAGELEGTVLGWRRDSLIVVRPGAAPIAVPLASVTSASVYRGLERGVGARKSAKWGAGVGLGLGLFNVAFGDCSGPHCEADDHAHGVAAFTAVGAGVGALVGSAVRAERWARIRLPPRTDAATVVARTASAGVIAGSEYGERLTTPTRVALVPRRGQLMLSVTVGF